MQRLPVLDYCRFVAAASVLSFHYFWNGIANGKIASLDHVAALGAWARYGYLGVNLFFIISGYVIFMSARRRTAAQFFAGRAARLYPAYLAAMLVTACIAHRFGSGDTSVTLKQVLGNVLMYQPLHHQQFVDGVYWTLMLEIRFYVAVGLLIAIGAQKHFETVFKLWPVLMLIAFLFGKGAWTSPDRGNVTLLGGYYAFFASGALFAILRTDRSPTTYVALALSTALAMRYTLAMADEHAVTAVIVGAFTALLFFVNWSAERGITALPAASALGALTYPLYLVHAHVGYMLLSHFASPAHRVLSYGLVIAVVLVLAWLIHELIEVRLAWLWQRVFGHLASLCERAPRALLGRPIPQPAPQPDYGAARVDVSE